MKVFLIKDVARIGLSGEIIKVSDGYARNYLIPNGLALEVTPQNAAHFQARTRTLEHRKQVIATETSMLAEKISNLKLTIKQKMHDDGKLYGAISQNEIVDLLAKEGVAVAKSQIVIEKSIKTKGAHEIVVKLSSRLQPKLTIMVQPEKA